MAGGEGRLDSGITQLENDAIANCGGVFGGLTFAMLVGVGGSAAARPSPLLGGKTPAELASESPLLSSSDPLGPLIDAGLDPRNAKVDLAALTYLLGADALGNEVEATTLADLLSLSERQVLAITSEALPVCKLLSIESCTAPDTLEINTRSPNATSATDQAPSEADWAARAKEWAAKSTVSKALANNLCTWAIPDEHEGGTLEPDQPPPPPPENNCRPLSPQNDAQGGHKQNPHTTVQQEKKRQLVDAQVAAAKAALKAATADDRKARDETVPEIMRRSSLVGRVSFGISARDVRPALGPGADAWNVNTPGAKLHIGKIPGPSLHQTSDGERISGKNVVGTASESASLAVELPAATSIVGVPAALFRHRSRSRSQKPLCSRTGRKNRKRSRSKSSSHIQSRHCRNQSLAQTSLKNVSTLAGAPSVTRRRGLGGFDTTAETAVGKDTRTANIAIVRQIASLAGWAQYLMGDGAVFYHNIRTGFATWEEPSDFTAARPSPTRKSSASGGDDQIADVANKNSTATRKPRASGGECDKTSDVTARAAPTRNQCASGGGSEKARLLVRNLPTSWTESDLESRFRPFGTIARATLQRGSNGLSRGCGFVAYVRAVDASLALTSMNGTIMDGKSLNVSIMS